MYGQSFNIHKLYNMAKAAKGRGRTARIPRKKRGANLLVEQPEEIKFKNETSTHDIMLRERCLNFVTSLNSGKGMQLSELIDQAKDIFEFIRYGAPSMKYFGTPLPEKEIMEMAEKANGSADLASIPEPYLQPVPETNHRSKFEEITM